MKITPGCIVRIEYELRVKGGDVIEKSSPGAPLQYVQGEGKLLPALEKRMEGLETGSTLLGEIPAGEAVPEDRLPVKVIPRKEFPKEGAIELQGLYEAHTTAGNTVDLRVLAFDADTVTVRMLPSIAGKDLAFSVRVMMIEDPATHTRQVIKRQPPPPPAEALHIDAELVEDN